jgi:uncharacterized membrane protein YoaK (UPF0700 family)/anti-anti-sigma regulatory factor
MLSAEAYSFRLKSRLAISLSWIAGFTNVVTLIAFGQVVSHQTGNSTHVGLAVGQMMLGTPGALREVLYFVFLLGAFVMGAMASAFMTEGARRAGWASKYIMPMSVEGILLSIFMILMLRHPHLEMTDYENLYAVTGVAAFAMGLQNATITKISGAIVRTTHLTGVITDFGLESVQLFLWWRDKVHGAGAGRYGRVLKVSRRHPTVLRVLLLASIFGSFLFGTVLGTVAFLKFGPPALLAPVLFLVAIVLIDYFTPIADVREIDPTRDKELSALLGSFKALLPAEVGIFRLAHHNAARLHRAPDFTAWTDRIPHHWRVVILVISPLTRFNSDSATSLLTAVQKMGTQGRTIVISGMNRAQFKTLTGCGLAKSIDLDNFVPDLEYAIARGMNLAENLKENHGTTV